MAYKKADFELESAPIAKVPKVSKVAANEENSVVLSRDCAMKRMNEFLYTPTQQKIKDILEGMKNLLLYKNRKYGDSAINPKKIFYKGDSTNSILIRLDDKLGRVMSNTEEKPRVNDVADIIGYCTLLLISMGVTSEDLKKFMDQENKTENRTYNKETKFKL